MLVAVAVEEMEQVHLEAQVVVEQQVIFLKVLELLELQILEVAVVVVLVVVLMVVLVQQEVLVSLSFRFLHHNQAVTNISTQHQDNGQHLLV